MEENKLCYEKVTFCIYVEELEYFLFILKYRNLTYKKEIMNLSILFCIIFFHNITL